MENSGHISQGLLFLSHCTATRVSLLNLLHEHMVCAWTVGCLKTNVPRTFSLSHQSTLSLQEFVKIAISMKSNHFMAPIASALGEQIWAMALDLPALQTVCN